MKLRLAIRMVAFLLVSMSIAGLPSQAQTAVSWNGEAVTGTPLPIGAAESFRIMGVGRPTTSPSATAKRKL